MELLAQESEAEFAYLVDNYEELTQRCSRRCFGTLSRWMPYEQASGIHELAPEQVLGDLIINTQVNDERIFEPSHFAAVLAKILPTAKGPHPRSPVRSIGIGTGETGDTQVILDEDEILINPDLGAMKRGPTFLLGLRATFFLYVESIVLADLKERRNLTNGLTHPEEDRWEAEAKKQLGLLQGALQGLPPTSLRSGSYWSARELAHLKPRREETLIGELAEIATTHVFGYAFSERSQPLSDRWHCRAIAMEYLRAVAM